MKIYDPMCLIGHLWLTGQDKWFLHERLLMITYMVLTFMMKYNGNKNWIWNRIPYAQNLVFIVITDSYNYQFYAHLTAYIHIDSHISRDLFNVHWNSTFCFIFYFENIRLSVRDAFSLKDQNLGLS